MTKLKETTQAILIYMTTSFFLILSQSNLKKNNLFWDFMPVLIGVKAKATLNGKRMHVDREGEQRRRGKVGLV